MPCGDYATTVPICNNRAGEAVLTDQALDLINLLLRVGAGIALVWRKISDRLKADR